MTHTPGPWTVEVLQELTDTGERRPVSYISASKGWANSGMASKRTIATVGHWRDRPNPEDDACLIAVAPELLKELENLVDIIEGDISLGGYGETKEAQEIIQKAKGERR